MKNLADTLAMGKSYLSKEIDALVHVRDKMSSGFTESVELLFNLKGKAIITGVGKSGIVAHKIASTLASTGTVAVFLHPTEGLHGDLGIVLGNDVVIALSNSGKTYEILSLLPGIRQMEAKLIAMVGNTDSELARSADVVIDVAVQEEACPLSLAPTSSTTAAMAIGDALALVLMKLRNFTHNDFARYHPGGMLGKRTLLRVADLMNFGDVDHCVLVHSKFEDLICTMTAGLTGIVNVIDNKNRLVGIVTGEDIRRSFSWKAAVFEKTAEELMSPNLVAVTPETLAYEALQIIKNRPISVLPVVNQERKCIGTLSLHDLVQAGFGDTC